MGCGQEGAEGDPEEAVAVGTGGVCAAGQRTPVFFAPFRAPRSEPLAAIPRFNLRGPVRLGLFATSLCGKGSLPR